MYAIPTAMKAGWENGRKYAEHESGALGFHRASALRLTPARYLSVDRTEGLPHGTLPNGNSGPRHSLADSPHHAGRTDFLAYGLAVHLLLLPTPFHHDAVAG